MMFSSVWHICAPTLGAHLGAYGYDGGYEYDRALLDKILWSSRVVTQSAILGAWMSEIQVAQASSGPQSKALILPSIVLDDIMAHLRHLPPLPGWDSHPATVGPKEFLLDIRRWILDRARSGEPDYKRYERGEDMVIHSPDLRHAFDQGLVSYTALLQSEQDAFFLTLHLLGARVRLYGWQLRLMAVCRDMRCDTHLIPWHWALVNASRLITELFNNARGWLRQLHWADVCTGWQLPGFTKSPAEAMQGWTQQTFHLVPVGDFGAVPKSRCRVPFGFKVPAWLCHFSSAVWDSRNAVEYEFFMAMHQQELPPVWLPRHPDASCMFMWLFHWHPLHTSPLLPASDLHEAFQPVHPHWVRTRGGLNFHHLMPGPWRLY